MKRRKEFDRGLEVGKGERTVFYEVFARRDSSEALWHVGSIQAPNDDLAQVRAWYIYDQHEWKEMNVVPTSAIVPITEANKSIKIKVA